MSINFAAKIYNVPATTLRRHLKNSSANKQLGASACLGAEIETKICNHIKKLQAHGFAPTRESVCKMAYSIAEQYNIPHRFSKDLKKAGRGWLELFLNRHPDLAIRKAEGVSQARVLGMNRQEVATYFDLLEKILIENNLMGKARNIFNMDETGCQLNNKPELVVAEKGSKNVAAITSAGKGETITVIACCNAEGNFLPPVCVFKGKNKKPEFEDGMPPGSVVYMGEKSAYVTSEFFFLWLKEHFVPRKPMGKVLLILDGHSSHCSNSEMLEYAAVNDIVLLCLPPHSTQFLQPLDRTFFRSLKAHYNTACNTFLKKQSFSKNNQASVRKTALRSMEFLCYYK
ncbi:uncharacterized protein LOC129905229 [Episyrphus balteatus]|uniref:uncharacterized protein LOC129905229 n=1 Tax=Episyrphus balteatus TaxID=286459 RepID=UPI0024851C8D|nr:uncharacterized protein LOC129905229 [Episyrphus balteatus]XP_055836644.1 uncharacterized protein LOC129905229 [Episyrphus balteatus]XP_055836647.1 uncharacterized protein LOC129905229 [Episyrphus balteatus]